MKKIFYFLLLAYCLVAGPLYAQPPAPGYTGTTTICTGNATTLTATGQSGATFRWWDAPTGGNLKSSAAGYTIDVQNTAGVYHWYAEQTVGGLTGPRVDVTVTVNQTPTVSITPVTASVCAGSSITLTASGAGTYLWTPGNTTGATVSVSPTVNTQYTVTGTANGCSANATRMVTFNKTVASADVTTCPGYTTTLTASGAATYVWNPGNLNGASVNVSPNVTTTYVVSGTGSGCTTTDTVIVTARPQVGLVPGSNMTVPEGTVVNLTCSASLPATFAWSPNNGSAGALSGTSVYVVPTQTTTYTVTATDGFGCNSTATQVITLGKLAAVTGNTTVCSGSATTLTATGTGPFAWYDAASGGALLSSNAGYNTGNLTADRSYWVSGSGGPRKEVKVSVVTTQVAGVTAMPAAICQGATSRLKATYLGAIRWYDAPTAGALVGTTTSDTSLPVTPAVTTTYYAEGVPAQISYTFNYTGAVQTWTVPPGVTSINVDAYGSAGETLPATKPYNSKGGRVQATLNVTPGQVLNIYVGGKESFNGGGPRAITSGTYIGARGGDATDIRIGGTSLTDRVLVAGGGGGAGRNAGTVNLSANVGNGGGLTGQDGGMMNVGSGASYGTGATQFAGGTGGIMNGVTTSTNAGLDGVFGQGGRSGAYSSQHTGGSGGGGWYGGGGGTASGDGGGGSSYTNPMLCSNVTHTQGSWNDVGVVYISYGVTCSTTPRVPVTVTVTPTYTAIAADTQADPCLGSAIDLYATGLAPYKDVAVFNGSNTGNNAGFANITSVSNNFTMEFWVKPAATLAAMTQSTGGTAGISGQQYAIMPFQSGVNGGAGVSVGTNGINVCEHGNSYLPALLAYNGAVSSTDFTHVAVVYTNKQPALYLNGALVATGLTSTMANVYPSIGSGGYGTFAGSLDNVRIWNAPLSQAEIMSVKNKADAAVPGKTLVARYSFDNGSLADDKGVPAKASWNAPASTQQQSYYTYTWSGTAAVPAASFLEKQTATAELGTQAYVVKVSRAGCSGPTSDTVWAITDAVPAATIGGGAVVCANASSPVITFTGSGSATPYTFTYNVNNGANQTISTPAAAAIRYIRVKQNGTAAGNYLHLAEIRAIESGTGANVALGKGGIASGTSSGFPITNLTDNNPATYWHSQNPSSNEYVQLDLGAAYLLDRVELVNRQDCCWERAASLQLILNNAAGVTYTSTAINAYQNQNNGYTTSWPVVAPSSVTLQAPTTAAGSFQYNLVSVKSKAGCSAAPGGNTTVTVHPYANITTEPVVSQSVCTTNPVVLNVVATDATAFQWRKNGANITTATSAVYIKPGGVAGDAGVYSVIAIGNNGCNDTSANSTVTVNSMSNSLPVAAATASNMHVDGLDFNYTDANCHPIANISDAVSGNVLGTVNAAVTIDGAVQNFLGQPYLQRHYELQPASDGAATVKLYATQAEFNAYNTYLGTIISNWTALPTGPADTAGKANINILQFHGAASSGTSGPGGQYNAAQKEVIANAQVTTTWNGNYWVLSFPVTGFSGFFITTKEQTIPLSVRLKDISARNTGDQNEVRWTTAAESAGDYFDVERSLDSRSFTAIGSLKARSINGGDYVFIDEHPASGINYYRLSMKGADGQPAYSKVVSAFVKQGSFVVAAYPNPAVNAVTLRAYGKVSGTARVSIMDISGRLLREVIMSTPEVTIPVTDLAPGHYLFRYQDEVHRQHFKINKQ
ncbi:glycine-rich protein [Taibaiella chishuiensis]|uniref:receptor protein-tyrosine kinase n=1 Tax=Taibaiella chishuiensis TaxID=1434707 RepID=A0A2P8CZK7_9BACT|nr:glycine-rich protein [Taibaiella chishuiensis]PSK90400.1 F5/8 type C domain-containing protein [Taibaiella chishuiensis]